MVAREQPGLRDRMLDAAEVVVVRQGIANLTLDAVAGEAGQSKSGMLHHFPSKDRLIEAMVTRAAANQRAYYQNACARAPEGAGRMARGVLTNCLTERAGPINSGAAPPRYRPRLAHNPALIEPMRAVYSELYRSLEGEGLSEGAGEAIAAAADGLWLNWALGLVPVDQARLTRVRSALETLLTPAKPSRPARKSSKRPEP